MEYWTGQLGLGLKSTNGFLTDLAHKLLFGPLTDSSQKHQRINHRLFMKLPVLL